MNFILKERIFCIFTRRTDVVCLYDDDYIILSNIKEGVNFICKELQWTQYKLTDKVTMEEYLGIMIMHDDDGLYRIPKPLLIDCMIESVHLFLNIPL